MIADYDEELLRDFKESWKAGGPTTTRDCLIYLDLMGWSELIDTRWRRQVEKELRQMFGERLSEEVLKDAVSVVLSPDEELPEEEYEYLDDMFDEFTVKRKKELGI